MTKTNGNCESDGGRNVNKNREETEDRYTAIRFDSYYTSSPQKQFYCTHCPSGFYTQKGLQMHVRNWHIPRGNITLPVRNDVTEQVYDEHHMKWDIMNTEGNNTEDININLSFGDNSISDQTLLNNMPGQIGNLSNDDIDFTLLNYLPEPEKCLSIVAGIHDEGANKSHSDIELERDDLDDKTGECVILLYKSFKYNF